MSVGDLSDPESLRAALVDVSRAFLLTPGMPYHPGAVPLAQCFIGAAKATRVDYIVRQSIWGASADAAKPQVMKDHAQIDADLVESGIAYTLLHTNYSMQALEAQGIIASAKASGQIFHALRRGGRLLRRYA